jgi:hypothetical protein
LLPESFDHASITQFRRLGPRPTEVAWSLVFAVRNRGSGIAQENVMAKGQKRSNREIRKPKKKAEPAVAPVALTRGTPISIGKPRKSG